MFILEKPYVSEFMVDTLVNNDWAVLDNQIVEESDIEEDAFNLWSTKKAVDYYLFQEFPLIYSNSENATDWVLENLPKSNISSYIRFFKDKIEFRELLKEIFPNFYFKAIEFENLKTLKQEDLRFPLVLKPSVGFLSLGVHSINDFSEWNDVLKKLKTEMDYATSIYPANVVNSSKFILEEKILGDEYAIDAYYDRNGDIVIVNIFQHPFLNETDVRDRVYITSADIMIRYMAKFAQLLRKIGELKNIRNFPLHMEVRVTPEGEIIPIEINPMRFAGWCTTDVAKYAWNINVYECFYSQKRPNWNNILAQKGKEIYYFSMAEVPSGYTNKHINEYDYNGLLANYSNVLEVRRINPNVYPLFAVIFGSTNDENEIKRILEIKTEKYIIS